MALTRGSRSGDNPGLREVSLSGNFSVDGDKQERRRGPPAGGGTVAVIQRRVPPTRGGVACHAQAVLHTPTLDKQNVCRHGRGIGFPPVESTQSSARSQTPLADPPPTSQRLLPSARGCRLCGYPGSVALNTTSTLKGLLALRSPVKRGIHTRFPDVRGNPFRIEGVSKGGPDPG